MTGAVRIEIDFNMLRYDLIFRRNISVVYGDSGTGKTTLCNIVTLYRIGTDPGLHVKITAECEEKVDIRVLTDDDWEGTIHRYNNVVFFIDEAATFVRTVEFASAIKSTSNYYVIFTRHGVQLKTLPVSIEEMYEFTASPVTNTMMQNRVVCCNKNTRRWNSIYANSNIPSQQIVTEDEKTGFWFFNSFCPNCISAHGAAGVRSTIENLNSLPTAVIIDGAAFGAYMADLIISCRACRVPLSIYFPESFEWLLLYSVVFANDIQVQQILRYPTRFINSSDYFSWERYYTAALRAACAKYGIVYHKGKNLNTIFMTSSNIKRLLTVLGLPYNQWLMNINARGE